jgi:predicted ABC-type ATPase
MWIVAGPNGAGKSTLTNVFLANLRKQGLPELKKLNADEVTAALRAADPFSVQADLNLAAARDIDTQVVSCIESGTNFLVETVLSSDKYRDDLEHAQAAGFNVGMIYVSLHPPELSPLRVQERVKKGGHDVDPVTAVQRHRRSHAQLAWFAPRVDRLFVYDNSAIGGPPRLIFSKVEGKTFFYNPAIINDGVARALKSAFGQQLKGLI